MKKLHARELCRNQPTLGFDVILQHDWPIEKCLLHIRVFFGGKTKRPRFDLFIRWLIKQITKLTETIFQGRMKIALYATKRSKFVDGKPTPKIDWTEFV